MRSVEAVLGGQRAGQRRCASRDVADRSGFLHHFLTGGELDPFQRLLLQLGILGHDKSVRQIEALDVLRILVIGRNGAEADLADNLGLRRVLCDLGDRRRHFRHRAAALQELA
ncbi:hypothetical protein D3C71_1580130 [compost metagenome]